MDNFQKLDKQYRIYFERYGTPEFGSWAKDNRDSNGPYHEQITKLRRELRAAKSTYQEELYKKTLDQYLKLFLTINQEIALSVAKKANNDYTKIPLVYLVNLPNKKPLFEYKRVSDGKPVMVYSRFFNRKLCPTDHLYITVDEIMAAELDLAALKQDNTWLDKAMLLREYFHGMTLESVSHD